METEPDISYVKRRRSIVKSSCTRIKNYVDNIATVSPTVISQLHERKLKLDQHWTEYDKFQTQLEMQDDSECSDRPIFEEAFYELSGRIRDLLSTPSVSRSTAAASPALSNASDHSQFPLNVRLPRLDLPKFSGKYEEWFPFHDAFRSVIHSNPSLSDIHKLQYLRAATTDDAHKIIASLETSDENYAVAWNLLKERYDNKRIIVQNHLKAMLELPVMHKESASELRQIADGAARHIQALKALKRPTDSWDDLLVYLLSSKLDSNTTRDWQKSLVNDELPTFKQFLDFLVHHCQVLESAQRAVNGSAKHVTTRSQVNSKQKALCNAVVKVKCDFCNGEHSIHQCKQFLSLSIPQRIDKVRSRKMCFNCLRSVAHTSNKCPSGSCKICSRKHNTLLHLSTAPSNADQPINDSKQESSALESATPGSSSVVVTHSSNSALSARALLSTAIVYVQGNDGSQHLARVLLDSGSQANLITKPLIDALGLIPRSVDVTISGINGTTARSTECVQVKLRSRLNSFSTVIDCIVTDRVTDDLPAFNIKRSAFDVPRNIQLADPKFNITSGIDILIGVEVFWNLICVGQIKASDKHPTLQKTKLGWILAGRQNSPPASSQHVRVLHSSISNSELNEQLHKFWQLDGIHDNSAKHTLEEGQCETHFKETVSRNSQGRYIVQIPFKEALLSNLGDSRDIALRRFIALERRFNRDSILKERYSEFMREYLSLGHMRPIVEHIPNEIGAYYMPHHCVIKEDAKGTKLRVVFDGSCKTDTGTSLNDSMMIGPVVQNDLTSTLLRFRTSRYALVADIKKMYRQILIHPSQTQFQRILWREDTSSEVQAFELATVTYGTAAASYLATRCLLDLAEQHSDEFPIGSLCLRRDFYVDDMLTGADSKSDALTLRDQIIQLLRLGSFELGKWGSNCPELLKDINDQCEGLIPFEKGDDFRILGILWDRVNDAFQFSFTPPQSPNVTSKRTILSEVSRLFDPLGLLGPIIVVAKIILQELWQSGVDWDESIPQDIHTKWMQMRLQLSSLSQLQVPRCIKYHTDAKFIQIHGYCDASQRAYGACIYIRTQIGPNEYRSHLLCSKSRVAPIKAVSLPRLELSAALLLSQLVDKVKSSFNCDNMKIYLWSDSTIALNWINSPSRRWSVFVANRVGEIQRLTDIRNWRHVSSPNNPADALSRGLLPEILVNSDLWWHGPGYLELPENQWPGSTFKHLKESLPEQRVTCATAILAESNIANHLINKFSNLNKICRILAYCLRFLKSSTPKASTLEISSTEYLHVLNTLCKIVQKQTFPREYNSLSKHEDISNYSNLSSLSPFMGDDELIRVGGRLRNSALSFNACHPIVLPRNHALTMRIVECEHVRNLHSGVQATMASVRQRFWPLALRSTTRKIINNCIKCFRAKPIFSEALMGSLPASRVTPSRPFAHCGVDYAGPVVLRESKRRNSRNHKAYIAVFVCFATKAIHLELVSDLTTDAFLAAFKRFISRRGKPNCVYSDNATTFQGAHRQMKELHEFVKTKKVQTDIEHFLRNQHTEWNFIPPNAPHFGGLWEAAVKSAKFHLARIIGGSHLTFEELQTVLCEIEAILNSRPLLPLSSDPNDMSYLSPGHFLVGSPLNSFPSLDLHDVSTNRLIRWQVTEQMRQHFWSRWSIEYLNSLQERHKWKRCKGQQLEPGQLVLIKQQGLAPLQWLTGRVDQVQAGSDGIARSATVRTANGSYVRPLSKLAIMPT